MNLIINSEDTIYNHSRILRNDLISLIVKTLSLIGLRFREVYSVKRDDVSIKNKKIYAIYGKKEKDRTFPMADSLIDNLKYYIENDRPNADTNYFFTFENSLVNMFIK